jgi:uncharacterized membrane protein
MAWYVYLLQFLSGMLLTNGIPHFVQGLSGQRFQSPFASPPGVGESSALSNVYWGFANLVGGIALLVKFAPTSPGDYLGWGLVSAGALLIGTHLAIRLEKLRARPGAVARSGT